LDSYIFDLMETHDYENIFFCQEKTLGLKAIIAIHNTTIWLCPVTQGTLERFARGGILHDSKGLLL
jgi:hypothetical protein